MDLGRSEVQRSWQEKATTLGRALPADAAAADVIQGAARAGLIDPGVDLLTAALAVEALAAESAAAAIALAMHTGVMLAVAGDDRFTGLVRGQTVGSIAMSAEQVPGETNGRLTGRANWVGPIADHGLALIGATQPAAADTQGEQLRGLAAYAVSLDGPGVAVEPVPTAGFRGMVCGHVTFDGASCTHLGSPVPTMARVRVLLAAAGLGMGRRALREALQAAHVYSRTGPGGEQTVQGLVADAATELAAATMLTWRAAASPALSLAEASMAKLASAEATQRAVARASQVVGADAFRRGHVVEQLAQDARALDMFAGRTEALREAIAVEKVHGRAG